MEATKNWREEKQSAFFYTIMYQTETHPLRKKLFKNLSEAAEEQAEIWAKNISDPNFTGEFEPSQRARLVGTLLRHLGPEKIRPILSAMKVRGLSVFNSINHERMHRGLNTASNLRAAVFGINDGLISNMGLLLGVAGAAANHSTIIITGVAGLLAGACSMAAGEYVSVRSQREVFEYQIALEKKELELYPEEETQELAMIYEARGIPETDARKVAELMINNPETGLDSLAREELGLNPNELGSPVGAMISSFIAFSIGAMIPLLPFIIGPSDWNLYLCIGLTALGLVVTGSILSIFTNSNFIYSGLRMLLVGSIAGVLTYTIGKLLGVALY